jgi:DNA replication and repair protein RecF
LKQLAELWIEGLRCIESAQLQIEPGSNLIFGANGAGKTSILEAAYLLGRGRSFRTRSTDRLIRHGAPLCRVRGTVVDTGHRRPGLSPSAALDGRSLAGSKSEPSACEQPLGESLLGDEAGLRHSLGIEISRSAPPKARIDQQTPPALADLARRFPVQILDPELHRLIEEGPGGRRRWLDWLVFHVEPGFAEVWSRYHRALRQRNAALQAGGLSAAAPWTEPLVSAGEQLAALRTRAFVAMAPGWAELCEALVGVPVSLGLYPGWDREATLADALARSAARDQERGLTGVGPHRADVTLRIGVRHAREVLSRGQQKLAGACLVLLQLEYLRKTQDTVPTLLLDDPSAELDQTRLEGLIQRIQALDAQLVITALTRDFALFGAPQAVFHVERGGVEKV